jgi:simple sugar transport system permease protein
MATVTQPIPSQARPLYEQLSQSPALKEVVRFLIAIALALGVFSIILILQSKSPYETYRDMYQSTLGSTYGRSEVGVKMIPLMLCALAVAIPARVGLVNVGGEGQLYIGAWLASWPALTFTDLPIYVLIPIMLVMGMIGGGLWALIPAVLRARGWMNETICTLLLNYVAILFVQYFVFGPWKDPLSANFPQSKDFPSAARLPTIGGTRLHYGIFIALISVAILYFVLKYTRWGYEMRAIGGNWEAARRSGIPIATYIIVTMMVGGAMAGLAGFGEVSAIQGRLRPGISPGYGYIGFLVCWLAGHNPISIVFMSALLAVLTAGGDSLQINQGLPYASVNLLMALTLFMVLAQRGRGRART